MRALRIGSMILTLGGLALAVPALGQDATDAPAEGDAPAETTSDDSSDESNDSADDTTTEPASESAEPEPAVESAASEAAPGAVPKTDGAVKKEGPEDATDQPLAVPGPQDRAPTARPDTGRAPAVQTTRVPTAPRAQGVPRPAKPDLPLFQVDAGYRLVWFGSPYAPTGGGLGGRPQFLHANGNVLLDKNFMTGLSVDMPINARPGFYPFVLEARVGWWENVFGAPGNRGPFGKLTGMKSTYFGLRWVHDHYRGEGGEWAGKTDTGGLIFGYAYAAPFGELTAITDTTFTLYLINWDRSAFPLGLLNQRIAVGFDPVFLDLRFRMDPGTGSELSLGVSFQTLLGVSEKKRKSGS